MYRKTPKCQTRYVQADSGTTLHPNYSWRSDGVADSPDYHRPHRTRWQQYLQPAGTSLLCRAICDSASGTAAKSVTCVPFITNADPLSAYTICFLSTCFVSAMLSCHTSAYVMGKVLT